eukprot:4182972-Pleurochrysis_carterae.AAC.1
MGAGDRQVAQGSYLSTYYVATWRAHTYTRLRARCPQAPAWEHTFSSPAHHHFLRQRLGRVGPRYESRGGRARRIWGCHTRSSQYVKGSKNGEV